MASEEKPGLGKPHDWLLALGGLVAVVGLLRLISGVWTPDAVASAGETNMLAAVITIAIGVVLAAISFVFKSKA